MRTLYRPMLWVTVALALVAAACGDSKSTSSDEENPEAVGNVGVIEEEGPGVRGGSLTYGLRAETDGWNPTLSRWSPDSLMVARAIFDTLITYDDEGGWQPFLAESMVPNDDYTEWTLKVRDGVTFHNGDPVDAVAVKANLDTFVASPLTGRIFDPVDRVELDPTDDLAVIAYMKYPFVSLPYVLATQIGVIAEPTWLATNDTRSPVATGPFVFESWEPDKELVANRNDSYWQEGLPYLDEVTFRPITDDASRVAALRAGDIDAALMGASEAQELAPQAEAGEFQIFNDTYGESNETFVQLNVSAPPFDDPVARRAVAMATDKEAYIDIIENGLYEPASGPFPPSSKWFAPSDYPEFDPEAARAAAAEYEATNGEPISFVVLVGPDATTRAGVDLLIEQWGQVGIEARAEGIQQADGILKVLSGDYQSILWQQFDSPNPVGDSVWWHPDSVGGEGEFSLNFARNVNPTIGEALDEARQTPDEDEQKRLYGTVQEELGKDMPYIWIFHGQISVVARAGLVNVTNWNTPDGVKGLPIQGGSHPLFQIWFLENQEGAGG